MPVNKGRTQKDKWNWTCPKCVKAHGVFATKEEAQHDLDVRHAAVCDGNQPKD